MSIEPVDRKSGRVWRVRWRDEEGRAKSRVIGTKRDAEAFDGEIKRRKRLGEIIEVTRESPTLAEFGEEWFRSYAMPHLAQRTRMSYASIWDRLLLPYLGDVRLKDLSGAEINELAGVLRGKGCGAPTIYRALTILQGVLQRAVEWGFIPSNPAALVRKPRVQRARAVRPLRRTEVERLRLMMDRHMDRRIVAFLAYAGLRPKELLALRWEDVTGGHVIVDKAVDADGTTKPTKNNKVRTIPVREDLRQALEREWDARHAWGMRHEGRVVKTQDGRPWNDDHWRRWTRRQWKRACAATGIQARPYDLRHTFVSQLIAEGVSIIEIARQAGHSPTMTLQVYGHIFEQEAS